MQGLMPIETISHCRGDSNGNQHHSEQVQIAAMQSGSRPFLNKVMFGSSHSKVSSPTLPLEAAANPARMVSTCTYSTAVNHSGQPGLYALAKLWPNTSLNRTFCGSPGLG